MQTHEIMTVLVDQYEQMIKDHELDLNNKKSGGRWGIRGWNRQTKQWCSGETRKKKVITFPNTNVYLSCNLSINYSAEKGKEYNNAYSKVIGEWEPNTNVVKVNFIMPQRKLHFTSEQIGEMMLEGEIFDSSEDIEEMKNKNSITPAEKRAKAEAQRKVREEKAKLKKEVKLKKDLEKINKKKVDGKTLTPKESLLLKETKTDSKKP